jgi:5-deoxy-glucuronate isomerase
MNHQFLPARDNANHPLFDGSAPAPHAWFNLVRLAAGATFSDRISGFETLWVPMSGLCDIDVDGVRFESVGGRRDVWSGKADSVYVGPGATVRILARHACELAVAGGRWEREMAAFRVRPDEVEMVDVGSNDTKSRRRIYHLLGQNGVGRAGNLLVSELYADEGCWSGYPSHKHDTDAAEETAHDEIYHWRFNPPSGFGAQLWYDDSGERHAFVTRDCDSFAFSSGYHPTVTSPGHASYIFTVLVGRVQRSLVQNFEPAHRHLMDKIPGIAAMRAKFK